MNGYVCSHLAEDQSKEEEQRYYPVTNSPVSGTKISSRSLQLTDLQVARPRYTDTTRRQQTDRSLNDIRRTKYDLRVVS